MFFSVGFIASCASVDVVGYLDDHPEFTPLLPRKGKTEYQVVWSSSWKPIVYLKAHLEQDEFAEYQRAFVSYSISKDTVSPLKQVEISMEEWVSIVEAVDRSPIWEYDSKCDELAYKERGIYFPEGDGCAEIIMTDGATITISVSEQSRKIGLSRVCNDLGPCKPFGDIPLAILKTIGKENVAN